MTEVSEQTIHIAPDAAIADIVPCYGFLWDPLDPACVSGCYAYARCGWRMASGTLPQMAAEMGLTNPNMMTGELNPQVDQLSIEQVLEVYPDIKSYSVTYAQQLYANRSIGLPVIQPDGTLTGSNKWSHSMPFEESKLEGDTVLEGIISEDVTAGQTVEVGSIDEDGNMVKSMNQVGESTGYDELVKGAEKALDALDDDAPSDDSGDIVLGVPEPIPNPDEGIKPEAKKVTKKKVVKKKKKKKVVKNAKTKKVVEDKPAKKVVQKKATTAKKVIPKAEHLAKKKKVTKKKVVAKKVAAPKVKSEPEVKSTAKKKKAGPKSEIAEALKFAQRFNRDRNRPKVASLALGHKFYGPNQEGPAILTDKGYKMGDKLYASLYEVMNAMRPPKEFPKQLTHDGHRPPGTRKMASMSAPRFFKLK